MFENALTTLDSTITIFMQLAFNELAAQVAPVLLGALGIVVMLYGFSVATGRDLSFSNTLALVIRIVVIYVLATSWLYFSPVIFQPLSQTPESVAVLIASKANATSINSLIDDFIVAGWNAIDVLQQKAGISNLGAFFLALVMMLATLLVAAMALLAFGLAKIVLALSIAVAPVFVSFLAFQSTRGWFESWLRMLLQAGLVLILASGTMGIVMAMATDGVNKLESATTAGTITATNCLGYLLLAFLTIVLMPQLNNIAASLAAGGAVLSIDGVRRMAQNTFGQFQRSNFEKYSRRLDGRNGKPVSTAGSVIAGTSLAAGWAFYNTIGRKRNEKRPPANPGTTDMSTAKPTPPSTAPDPNIQRTLQRAEQHRKLTRAMNDG